MSAGRVAYILVRGDWRYNDEWWSGGHELLRGYATREEAEAAVPGRMMFYGDNGLEQEYIVIEVPIHE